jgi:hypothetical protein
MQADDRNARDWDSLLERFAAELTGAAYPVALRHATDESWADLELELWKALSETVKKWGRDLRPRKKARMNPALRSDDFLVHAPK